MARYQFDEKTAHETGVGDVANGVLDFLVRLAGLALLCIGLWTGVAIIREAWILYQHPNQGAVERFAKAIDAGSHLDRVLAPKHLQDTAGGAGGDATSEFNAGTVAEPVPGKPSSAPAAKPTPAPAHGNAPTEELKLSYFVAWAILLLVMLLVGRLSIAAIKVGGELALHDVHLKRFARQLIREMHRERAD